jgi:hypothetical protein
MVLAAAGPLLTPPSSSTCSTFSWCTGTLSTACRKSPTCTLIFLFNPFICLRTYAGIEKEEEEVLYLEEEEEEEEVPHALTFRLRPNGACGGGGGGDLHLP